MKKVFVFFSTLVLSLLSGAQAFAAGAALTFSGSTTIDGNGSATITLSVSSVSGLDGVCGVSGRLSYDSSKITLSGASANNGFSLTQGTSIVAYKSECIKRGGIFSLTFKNKGLSDGGSTVVTFSGITVSGSAAEGSASSVSSRITYKAPKKASTPVKKNSSKTVQNNKVVTEKKEEKAKETKSNDSSLSEITFSVGKVEFSKDVFNYDLIVNSDVNYIEINAKPGDSKATISGAGKYDLKTEKTSIKLTVKAEDGSESIYTINILKDDAKPEQVQSGDNEEGLNWGMIVAIVVAVISVTFAGFMLFIVLKNRKKSSK